MALLVTRLTTKALWRPLWHHRWLTLMTLLGLALGSAVIIAIELINGSAREHFAEAASQLSGQATHRITTPSGWLDDSRFVALMMQFPEIRANPVIAGDVVTASGCRLQLLALDPLREAAFGRLSSRVQAPPVDLLSQSAALLDEAGAKQCALAPSDTITINQMVVTIADLVPAAPRPMLIMDIGWGQRLLQRPGQLTHIDLILDPHTASQLADWLPLPLQLVPAEALLSSGGVNRSLELNLFALGLLALVIGLFLVYNASHLLLLQRWPLLSQLHALGVGAPGLIRLLALEMLTLSLLGILLGTALGWLAASALLQAAGQSFSDHYDLTPITRLSPDWSVLLPLLATCLGGALLANLPGWLRLWRAPPGPGQPPSVDSFCRHRHGRRLRLALPLLLAMLGLPLALEASGVIGGFVSVAALLLATALVAPWLLSWLSQGIRHRRHWLTRLSLGEGERALNRTGVAIGALTIAIAANIGIGVMIHSFRLSVDLWLTQRLAADYYLRVANGIASFDQDALSALAKQPQVAALARRATRRISLQGRPLDLVGMELPPPLQQAYPLLDGHYPAAPTELLASESFLLLYGYRPGDTLTLPLANGSAQLTISGVYRDYGSENGQLLLDWPGWRHWMPDHPPQSVALFLTTEATGSRDTLATLLRQWPTLANAELSASGDIRRLAMAVFDRTFVVTGTLQWLTLGIAALGVIFAFTALGMARRPERQLLHGLGMSRGELRQMQLLQVCWPALIAGLLAIPSGLALAWLLTDVITPRSFGWKMHYDVPWQIPLQALATALLAGLIAAVVVTLREERQP